MAISVKFNISARATEEKDSTTNDNNSSNNNRSTWFYRFKEYQRWIIIKIRSRSVSISKFSLIIHIYICCTLYGAVECMLLLFRRRVMPQLRLFQARPIHTGPHLNRPSPLVAFSDCVFLYRSTAQVYSQVCTVILRYTQVHTLYHLFNTVGLHTGQITSHSLFLGFHLRVESSQQDY